MGRINSASFSNENEDEHPDPSQDCKQSGQGKQESCRRRRVGHSGPVDGHPEKEKCQWKNRKSIREDERKRHNQQTRQDGDSDSTLSCPEKVQHRSPPAAAVRRPVCILMAEQVEGKFRPAILAPIAPAPAPPVAVSPRVAFVTLMCHRCTDCHCPSEIDLRLS